MHNCIYLWYCGDFQFSKQVDCYFTRGAERAFIQEVLKIIGNSRFEFDNIVSVRDLIKTGEQFLFWSFFTYQKKLQWQ